MSHVNENIEVHESFLGFYLAEETEGERLANLIKKVSLSLYKEDATRIPKGHPNTLLKFFEENLNIIKR